MPVVDSIDELNAALSAADDADDHRRIANRANSVGQDWDLEKLALQPVTDEPFDTALTVTPRVDRYAQIMVRCNQYSVPARFIGHRLRVKLSASHVTVYDRATVVARHPRAVGKGTRELDLDHYLEILARKPGALPGATALAQARAAKMFTTEHDAWWAAARKAYGDAAGTRALVEVLLLHRHLDRVDVLAGISAALSVGSANADVVALEARKAAERRTRADRHQNSSDAAAQALLLAHHHLGAAIVDKRPLPSVAPTTPCWAGRAHERPPSHRHRPSRSRGDRTGRPHATTAHDPRPLLRDRRRRRTRTTVLPGFPLGTDDR